MKANIERVSGVLSLKGIGIAEDRYKATYIGDFDLKDVNMDFTFPVAVFYQENPPEKSPEGNPCSNYLGLFYPFDNKMYVCDAKEILSKEIRGFIDTDGYFKYSHHRHHCQMSNDGAFGVDGGFSYTRTLGKVELLKAKVNKDHLEIKESI